jgi:hypothetical protein
MGLPKLAYNFGIREGIVNLNVRERTEAGIKVMRQGGKSNQEDTSLDWETVKILAKKHFDADNLSAIKVNGRLQWWIGGKSPMTDRKLIKDVIAQTNIKNPNVSRN